MAADVKNDIVDKLLSGCEFFGIKVDRKIVVLKDTDGYFYIIPKNGGRWVYRAQYEAFDGKTVTLNKTDYPAEVIEDLGEPKPKCEVKTETKREDVY